MAGDNAVIVKRIKRGREHAHHGASANRRLSIVLLREAAPVPPDHKL